MVSTTSIGLRTASMFVTLYLGCRMYSIVLIVCATPATCERIRLNQMCDSRKIRTLQMSLCICSGRISWIDCITRLKQNRKCYYYSRINETWPHTVQVINEKSDTCTRTYDLPRLKNKWTKQKCREENTCAVCVNYRCTHTRLSHRRHTRARQISYDDDVDVCLCSLCVPMTGAC